MTLNRRGKWTIQAWGFGKYIFWIGVVLSILSFVFSGARFLGFALLLVFSLSIFVLPYVLSRYVRSDGIGVLLMFVFFALAGFACYQGARLKDGGVSFLAISLVFSSVVDRLKFAVEPSGAEPSGLPGGEGVASGRME
jgi:hypothetical protein